VDIYIGWSELISAENCFESCLDRLAGAGLSKAEKAKLKKRMDVSFADYLAWKKLDRSVLTKHTAYGSFNGNILAIRFSARIDEKINTVGFTLASRFPLTSEVPPAVAAFGWLSSLAHKSATPIRLIGLPGLKDFVYQWKLALAAWPSNQSTVRSSSSLVNLFDSCGFECVELIAAEDCRHLLENASQNLRRTVAKEPESEAELELRDLANDYAAVRDQWRGVAVDSMQDIQCILAVSTLWGRV